MVERPGRTISDSIDGLLSTLRDQPGRAHRPDELAKVIDSDAHSDDTCILTLRLTESSWSRRGALND